MPNINPVIGISYVKMNNLERTIANDPKSDKIIRCIKFTRDSLWQYSIDVYQHFISLLEMKEIARRAIETGSANIKYFSTKDRWIVNAEY